MSDLGQAAQQRIEGARMPVFDARIGIRPAEGGYIVSLHSGDSKIALREEIYTAKADAIAAATRLHASSLAAMEQWVAEAETRRTQVQQHRVPPTTPEQGPRQW